MQAGMQMNAKAQPLAFWMLLQLIEQQLRLSAADSLEYVYHIRMFLPAACAPDPCSGPNVSAATSK